MSHEHEEASPPRIDISACLDAARMYDATYHRDRDNPVAAPQKVVSLWEYLWAQSIKTGAGLLGRGLLLTLLIAVVLVLANGVHNYIDYQKAQPIIHSGSPPPHGLLDEANRINIVLNADGPGTWSEPSPDPLPKDWAESNTHIYLTLFWLIFFSFSGGVFCLRRAKRVKDMVPIQYADTAYLPARESLVRASQEPGQDSLVRASALPPTPSGMLLRSVGAGKETPPEQLVRPAGGPE